MKKLTALIFLLVGLCQAQTWEVGLTDSTIQLHDFFYFQNGKPTYAGNSSDSVGYSRKLAQLALRGIEKDSIRIFFHWHYLVPDSSNVILRNYNNMAFDLDTLGDYRHDEDWWSIIMGNVSIPAMPVEW